MTDETKAERDSTLTQDSDDRSYEAPAISTLGTTGELTSANEASGPDNLKP